MSNRSPSFLARYAVALLSVVIATGIRWLLTPILGNAYPFAPVFLAVVFSAWYGGFGPTVLAALLGFVAAVQFLVPQQPAGANPAAWQFGLFLYALMSVSIATVGGLMNRARRRVVKQMDELAQQREQLRATVNSIGDAVVVTDENGRITSLNPVAEALTGWTLADAASRSLDEVFSLINEQTRDKVESPVQRVLRDGLVVGLANHTVLVCKDGRERPIDDSAAPIRDAAGAMTGVVLVFRDITERRAVHRQLEESERRFRMMADAAPVMIWTSGVDKKCDYFNRPWLEFTGRTLAQELGDGWTEGVHPGDLGRCQETYTTAFDAGQPFRMEYRLRRHDAQYRWVLDIGVPRLALDGSFAGFIGSCLDLTDQRQSQERLRRSEERLRLALDAGRMGVWDWNVETGRMKGSDNLEAMYGLAAGSFAGTFEAFQQMVHHDDRMLVDQEINQTVTTGEALDVEFRIIRPDRGVRWIASQGRLHAESGQPLRMVGVAFDITERKQAEQTAQFLADASEALASLVDLKSTLEKVAKLAVPFFAEWCLVDLLDVDGILRRMAIAHGDPSQEESARTIFQRWPFSPGSEEGPRHVLRTGCSHLVSALTDDMLTRGVQEPALVARIQALGLRSYIGVPLTVRGKPLGVLTFLTAESGRRYGANDLAAAEDLAHRAAIAVENSQLYHALRESDRRKDEFLAVLAHELRNPLAPIASALEIMKAPSADAAAQSAARDVAERQLAHLRRLVDDLLDVSRIMRGKIELRKEPIQLATIVARAVESVQPLIDAAGHELTVKLPQGPLWLDVDPVRISQVISNLLSNAAKYTEPHGQIHIAALRDGDQVVIRVRDTGIGIATDALPYLFEMFMQVAPGASRSQGGLGIGLTLVKNLVEMHGGSITAHSDGHGQGSEFVITLPAMLTAPAAEVPQVALPPRFAAGRHVLVVDDNVDAAQSLTILLRLHGHRVRIVHGGEQALTAVAAEKPDLVLLDIGMPGMNGFEVARRLRERHGSADLTLVALTGWGQEQDRLRSKEAGFDHHLTKPVELTTLQAVLESCAAAGTAQLQ